MPPRTADELRRAFCDFFAARDHRVIASASLVPQDPTVLFTVAGMVPFKPYFVGDEPPPAPRAVSVQRCLRAGGKHNDLEEVGRSPRHNTFFEMLGNFSFGDYFKAEAVAWAWEFLTETLGLDPQRLWVTVHVDDDEAERLWREQVGVPPDRIQRLDEDNFWRMGDVGPCGPSSEIFWDRGAEHGAGGGPAEGSDDRYVELWNLVFMQFDQQPDGSRTPLPHPSIDTGAGLERNLAVLQGVDSIFEIDVFAPIIAAAERATGVRLGDDAERDVSLRILAEHARAMTFLVSDGIVPSNEERGYVLRRIIRRAVRHAYLLGAADPVTPALVDAVVEAMGDAYSELESGRAEIAAVLLREEEGFRSTLRRGLELLDEVLAERDVSGEEAFHLHDTLGFPIDLTREIALERGRSVDLEGFEEHMAEQRRRAREAQREDRTAAAPPTLRSIADEHGATEFTGRQEYESRARVVALVVDGERVDEVEAGHLASVFLDRTPFYAESGGQVGDTGVLRGPDGRAEVADTQYAVPGTLIAHDAAVVEGRLRVGDEVIASIDGERRDRIRRNHTATHVLHWALREVLGPSARQQGSLVGPDYLRFDFVHHAALTPEELARVEHLANAEVITDAPVRHYETTKEHAESIGAIAFFDERYGDVVRVLEAGEHSIELCGGTHVHALGFIGPIKIRSEGSIGTNVRRIDAVTGEAALEYIRHEEESLRRAAELLRTKPEEVPERLDAMLAQMKSLRAELDAMRARQAEGEAVRLADEATDGVVVARRDGLGPDDLRKLAQATLRRLGDGIVALVGEVDGKAAIAVAVGEQARADGASAADLAAPAARELRGGTAKNPEVVAGGGPEVEGIPAALERLGEVVAEFGRSAVAAG